jgi:HD-GYP domain-containing protein (c-di-GMP phosphodiesterase class II)
MSDQLQLSSDRQINHLLSDVVSRLKEYTEAQSEHINQLAKIGVMLSSTRNLPRLLETIVDQARSFTDCDGGTLYMRSADEKALEFKIVQNDTLKTRMGGATGDSINWPPVPLMVEGKPNNANVSAYVANSGKIVNIADVYEVEGFNFERTRQFDAGNRYRSKSMLVIPMRDHENEIIGVLQLINALDPDTKETIPFAPEYVEMTESLASQAAVAITNARLIHDLQNLFESFIQTIATAIDEKSHYTGGHITRVANLTMDIAHRVNDIKEGFFAETHFTDDELTELRIAAWLHDTGKITTPEYVVDKRTKLETIFDRKELVRMRFELAVTNARQRLAEVTGNLTSVGRSDAELERVRAESEAQIKTLLDEYNFVMSCNATQEFVPDAVIERLNGVSNNFVETSHGPEPMLTENELYNLSIRKGNLTKEERQIMENHCAMTIKMLEKLPFPRKMRNVPFIAGAHHEKLNGKGYPNHLQGTQIPLQARIMTLADVFEALTAKDRPYKEPKKMSEVLKILGFMVKDNELDANLIQFFIDQKLHIEYAHKYLDPTQLDVQ